MSTRGSLFVGIVSALCAVWVSSLEVKPAKAKVSSKGKVDYGQAREYASKSAPPAAPTPIEETEDLPKAAPYKAPSAFEDVERNSARGSDVSKQVYPVRAASGNGCAVSVAPDTLLTAWHVVRGGNVTVGVNGQWLPATVQPLPNANDANYDGAILRVSGGNFPASKTRAPKYAEEVTVYGCRTQSPMRGIVSTWRTVSLNASEQGVDQGDSGGAVVASDGSVVGVIAAYEGSAQTMNPPPNQRVVSITRADLFAPQQSFAANPWAVNQPQQPSIFGPQVTPQPQNYQGNCVPMQSGNCVPQAQFSFGFAPMQSYQGNCVPMQSGGYLYMKQTPRKTTIRYRS